jgi:hypothetical protein
LLFTSLEFDAAIKYVQNGRISQGMSKLGIATTQLTNLFLLLALILILLFIFIFFGINAFSVGGTFSSVINGALPVGAGVGVSQKAPVNSGPNGLTARIKSIVEQILTQGPD